MTEDADVIFTRVFVTSAALGALVIFGMLAAVM